VCLCVRVCVLVLPEARVWLHWWLGIDLHAKLAAYCLHHSPVQVSKVGTHRGFTSRMKAREWGKPRMALTMPFHVVHLVCPRCRAPHWSNGRQRHRR